LGFACCATLICAALRPSALQDQIQMFSFESRFYDRVLGNNTAIVFDIHLQVRSWKHPIAETQDFSEAFRREPMFDVASNVGLEDNLFLVAGRASAIDKLPDYVAHLRHVGVGWDKVSGRQNKTRVGIWMRLQRALQVQKVHILTDICLYRYVVKDDDLRI